MSTPRTRRYARPDRVRRGCDRVHSAHAEVRPPQAIWASPSTRPLRARGGTPSGVQPSLSGSRSTPRTRRYAPTPSRPPPGPPVHSAHAEVRPAGSSPRCRGRGPLRARGGTPATDLGRLLGQLSTPRTRRYAHADADDDVPVEVHSAHAEVRPQRPTYPGPSTRPLRARGGTPCLGKEERRSKESTPRTRRYARDPDCAGQDRRVHSAHAEVRPIGHISALVVAGPLRARGGTPRAWP